MANTIEIGKRRASTSYKGEQLISQFKLAIHFEASDFDSYLLMSDDLDGLLNQILESTQLKDEIALREDYDEEGATFFADFDGSSSEALLEAFSGEIKYGIVTAVFDAQLFNHQAVTWDHLSNVIREIRSRILPGTGIWSAFEVAPVGISISEIIDEDLGSSKSVDFSARGAMLAAIVELEDASTENEQAREFLDFYGPEIARIKGNRASVFLNHWMSTELALSQTNLTLASGDSGKVFEEIAFKISSFKWNLPDRLPVLLEIERSSSPEFVVWPSPLPANPFWKNSDGWWAYQDVLDGFFRVNPNATLFTPLKAAKLMQLLAAFQEEYSPSAAISSVLEKYADEISDVSATLGDEFDWDESLPLGSEQADFVQGIDLPENLEDFWADWLQAIGQSAAAPANQNVPTTQKSGALECTNCSATLDVDQVKFCSNCGTVIFDDEVLRFFAQYCNLEKLENSQFYICRPKGEHADTWQRLFYVMPGTTFVYVDVPFALKRDVDDLESETGAWGLGSFGAAQTYHNVLLRSAFTADPVGSYALIANMNQDAVASEQRLTQKD